MTDRSERRLMTKLAAALILLVGLGALFASNRAANVVIGLLIVTVGTYMVVRAVRLRDHGAS